MNRNRSAGLVVAILPGLSVRAHGFETESTIANTNGRDLANSPVFADVSSVFGNGIDFTQLSPSGFHIYDGSGVIRHGEQLSDRLCAWAEQNLFKPVMEAILPPVPYSDVITGIEWAPPDTIVRKGFDHGRSGYRPGDASGNWPVSWADDAPEPWGPWTCVYYTECWDVGPGETGSFPTKWMSPDGRTVHLVFSGDDTFAVRKATLAVGPFHP